MSLVLRGIYTYTAQAPPSQHLQTSIGKIQLKISKQVLRVLNEMTCIICIEGVKSRRVIKEGFIWVQIVQNSDRTHSVGLS